MRSMGNIACHKPPRSPCTAGLMTTVASPEVKNTLVRWQCQACKSAIACTYTVALYPYIEVITAAFPDFRCGQCTQLQALILDASAIGYSLDQVRSTARPDVWSVTTAGSNATLPCAIHHAPPLTTTQQHSQNSENLRDITGPLHGCIIHNP
jgi:hypothetical protein